MTGLTRVKIRKVQGSISLFFALFIPVLCLAMLAGFAYVERCAAEYDGARCLKSAGKLALASYTRSLWQSYGLWGLNPADVDLSECESILKDLPDLVGKEVLISYHNDLYQGSQLQEQINRYMKLRAPVLMGSDLLERMRVASASRCDLISQTALATIQEGHRQVSAYDLYQEGQGQMEKLPKQLPPEVKSREQANLSQDDLEEGLAELGPILRHFSRYMLPVYEAMGTQGVSAETAFDPSFIEKLASCLDSLLDTGLGVTTEAMNLGEYSQWYFPAAVNFERLPGAMTYLYTPQGVSLQELSQERPLELEQIISGLPNPRLADKYCQAMISGMRFIPQYIAGQRSPSRQLHYETWANFFSTALSVISLGEVQVPPEVMKYFVQAADSLRLARQDYQDLRNGYGLPFWPVEAMSTYTSGQYNMKFYYRDYLRLLAYTQPAQQLASSLCRLIQQQEPGPFYTSLQVSLVINQRKLEYTYAYLNE